MKGNPDKDLHLRLVERRAVQIGIASGFVPFYLDEAIIGIEDVTRQAQEIEALITAGNLAEAEARIPKMTEVSGDWLTDAVSPEFLALPDGAT